MGSIFLSLIYLMFFISGASGLVYQVVWVRSLTLIFGGSHLAVTVVLSIFMAGLSIGGYVFGRYADKVKNLLGFYGLLELGIGIFAIIFIGLMKLYPSIYIFLVGGKGDSHLYLSFIRILFSIVALIVPTTLMGGTLPVLTKFVSDKSKNLRGPLSYLYGINTLGAVFGAIAGGFFLLRFYTVTTTMTLAIFSNIFVGFFALLLQTKSTLLSISKGSQPIPSSSQFGNAGDIFVLKLVLLGIGISGFCALGYEVLWTRILTIVVGANVYSFTTMLASFLTGIALGSAAYGFLPKIFNIRDNDTKKSTILFGLVQIVIGVSALLVTIFIRKLPLDTIHLYNFFKKIGLGIFGIRLWSNFILAFSYMVIPAFFMGFAFPIAGKIHSEFRNKVGRGVGEVLAFNTIGAILGASVSGFFMIYLFGIERSLQMLIVINIGFGLIILSSLQRINRLRWIAFCLTISILLFLSIDQKRFRIWDPKYFAIFRNNQIEAFDTPEKIKDAMDNTDVLYYGEGVESIVSAIKIKGGEQAFITNGRIEASSHLQGRQVMLALGHLPMLLHKDPKNVLVIGLGSAMTLGSISLHPQLEKLTLIEIEPKVLNIAKNFENYNHHVLDNPKLRIIFNDGRNFLLTTNEKFDVITADPIHPWFRGAGYLYTKEYFKLASEHLRPGGIICQWLPLYELSPRDLKSIVMTFLQNFNYTMLWLTHYDGELIGSNSPFLIDEKELDRRISQPPVYEDLKQVMMGSATEFLSFFVMGRAGMKRLAEGGIINTDDNLYLEFSAPFSIGDSSVMGKNVDEIIKYRENILQYLVRPSSLEERIEQEKRWNDHQEALGITGQALSLFLSGKFNQPEFQKLLEELDHRFPNFSPAKILKNEYMAILEKEPKLLKRAALILLDDKGKKIRIEISAVLVPISKDRASVVFVDNDSRIIYGELYFSGPNKDQIINQFVNDVMLSIHSAYHKEAIDTLQKKGKLPPSAPTLLKIKKLITTKIQEKSAIK